MFIYFNLFTLLVTILLLANSSIIVVLSSWDYSRQNLRSVDFCRHSDRSMQVLLAYTLLTIALLPDLTFKKSYIFFLDISPFKQNTYKYKEVFKYNIYIYIPASATPARATRRIKVFMVTIEMVKSAHFSEVLYIVTSTGPFGPPQSPV